MTGDGDRIDAGRLSDAGPTSWRLERNLRRVTFAECAELSVFSETTSARVSAPHAHPAWTLLLPVDGGTVTVVAGDAVRVQNEGVLLAPQGRYSAATDRQALVPDSPARCPCSHSAPALSPGCRRLTARRSTAAEAP